MKCPRCDGKGRQLSGFTRIGATRAVFDDCKDCDTTGSVPSNLQILTAIERLEKLILNGRPRIRTAVAVHK
jgi:hypothetical protein